MCGIVGIFDHRGRLPATELFATCVESLRRRGPDDSGIWADGSMLLGHRRLAIVDLSPSGHQPMVSADGRFVIVFNGEIYNHLEVRRRLAPSGGWRTSSDTETLLESYRHWGVGCLEHLNGMFAFAIWDTAERRMFVARDRMGVKPLYYSWHDGTFAFASRPRALLPLLSSSGSEIDFDALRMYSELGYIPAPLSFYRGVHKLRPGHFLLVDARGARETCYWDYRHIAPDLSLLGRNENELADQLDELVRDATRARLMSDVPLGAFLSGGVDSAYVVAAMKASGVSVPNTFTIAFAEPKYDESPAAAAIARHIGVRHVTETLSVGDLLQLLPLYVEEVDEPLADSAAFPQMAVARLARQHVTVALTGDAGDELFGGYHYYHLLTQLHRTSGWPPLAKRSLQFALRMLPSHRAKLLAGALGTSTLAGTFNYMRTVSKDFGSFVSDTVLDQTQSSLRRFEQTAAGFAEGLSSADVGMRLDLAYTLADGYLQKVDVATMAMSLEARCPFVDYRLVEWAMRLPVQFKLRGRSTKYLLKKALCRYLPPSLVYQPKRGFCVPVGDWLRGPLRNWAQELLHDESVLSRVPLHRERISELFTLHASGARDVHPVLWGVLMLLCYVAKHDRGLELPPVMAKRAA